MAHPDGTKAWRKGWRRRWREGSSFRALSPVAKVIVHWVEENCDDDGVVVTTMRHMAGIAGGDHPKTKVNRMRAWRALQEACRAKILRTEALQPTLQDSVHAPTKITRLNFKEYQGQSEGQSEESVTGIDSEAGLSGRREQKKAEETKKGAATAAAPGWQELIAGLTGCWTAAYHGQKLVWQPRDFKALKTLRASLDDAEILRRFGIYLANRDPFYVGHPVATFCGQVNRFVAGAVPDIRVGSAPAQSHQVFKAGGGGLKPWA